MDREAFSEGERAAIMGQSEFSNPYDPDDEPEAHQAWDEGWHSVEGDE